MGKGRTGRSGSDATLRVPAGTEIFDYETEELLADLTEVGLLVPPGGAEVVDLYFPMPEGRRPGRVRRTAIAPPFRRCGT